MKKLPGIIEWPKVEKCLAIYTELDDNERHAFWRAVKQARNVETKEKLATFNHGDLVEFRVNKPRKGYFNTLLTGKVVSFGTKMVQVDVYRDGRVMKWRVHPALLTNLTKVS